MEGRTINHYRAALLQLFNFALKSNLIRSNPVAAVNKVKTKSGDIGLLTPKQVSGLLIHSSPEIQAAVAIGLFAGLRRSEIGRMTWEDIHFEKGFLEVRAKNSKSAARAIQLGRVNDVISRFPQIKSTLRPEILILRHFLEAVTSKTWGKSVKFSLAG